MGGLGKKGDGGEGEKRRKKGRAKSAQFRKKIAWERRARGLRVMTQRNTKIQGEGAKQLAGADATIQNRQFPRCAWCPQEGTRLFSLGVPSATQTGPSHPFHSMKVMPTQRRC